jgi:hypothetical protein
MSQRWCHRFRGVCGLLRHPRCGEYDYFSSAQAYELISAPSAISMIFGVFQVIRRSFAPFTKLRTNAIGLQVHGQATNAAD